MIFMVNNHVVEVNPSVDIYSYGEVLKEAGVLEWVSVFRDCTVKVYYNYENKRTWGLMIYVNDHKIFQWFSCFSLYSLEECFKDFVNQYSKKKTA